MAFVYTAVGAIARIGVLRGLYRLFKSCFYYDIGPVECGPELADNVGQRDGEVCLQPWKSKRENHL